MKYLFSFCLLLFHFYSAEEGQGVSAEDSLMQKGTDDDQAFEEEFKYKLTDEVKVQIVDKISGDVVIKKVKVNVPFAYKRIRVIVRKCFVPPIDKALNYTGFVEIFHIPYSKSIEKVFSNWMFTENITVNMFEHPVYDVKLIR